MMNPLGENEYYDPIYLVPKLVHTDKVWSQTKQVIPMHGLIGCESLPAFQSPTRLWSALSSSFNCIAPKETAKNSRNKIHMVKNHNRYCHQGEESDETWRRLYEQLWAITKHQMSPQYANQNFKTKSTTSRCQADHFSDTMTIINETMRYCDGVHTKYLDILDESLDPVIRQHLFDYDNKCWHQQIITFEW